MDAMRWTILSVGVLVLIGIYALGRWRERRRQEAARAADPARGGPAADSGGAAGPGSAAQGAAGQGRRVIIDDDLESGGIGDLLGDDELAPDGFDLGVGPAEGPAERARAAAPSEAQDAAGQAVGPEADTAQSVGPEADTAGREPAGSRRKAGTEAPPAEPTAGAASVPGQSPAQPAGGDRAAPGASPSQAAAAERGDGQAGRPAADEPPPLRLPPASQVEIDAYRNGGVPEAERLMLAFVAAGEGQRFHGPDIEAALRAVRMVPGEHRAWHRRGESDAGPVTLFSAANMVEPGYLDPEETLPGLRTPGIVFFMQLPLPVESEDVLDAMLATAYQVSVHLGGELLDRSRSTMTQQIAEHMREQLREHRRQLHIAMHKRG